MTDYPLSNIPLNKIAYANDLHRQCTGLADRVQALGQRMWQTAVVLGYTLVQLKAELPHGEYTRLFASTGATSNVAHVQHLNFSRSTATRYVNLYKALDQRMRKLGGDRAAAMESMIQQGSMDELALALGDVSQASSLREAYIELGVIAAPKTPQESILANRNTAGRPKGSVTPPSPWEDERALAVNRAAEIATLLEDFLRAGKMAYLAPNEIEGFRASLATSLATIKAYRPGVVDTQDFVAL